LRELLQTSHSEPYTRASPIGRALLSVCAAIRSAFEPKPSDQYRTAVDNMWQGLVLYGEDGRVLLASPQFCAMLALPSDQVRPKVTSRRIFDLQVEAGHFKGADAERAWSEDVALVRSRRSALDYIDLPDGRTLAQSHQPIAAGGWVRTYADVTGRRNFEARIVHMARHDALTDLPNRITFYERLDQALDSRTQERPSFAVMFVDLDDFKAVNDMMGHAIGDALLVKVASRLREHATVDDTIARLGGDEFAVLKVGVSGPDQAGQAAMRLIASVSRPYVIEGTRVSVGTSVGVALGPGDGLSADMLMRNADSALYRAKRDGAGVHRICETVRAA
jgi:diguanylate cyclase (GGDEF)-like protein